MRLIVGILIFLQIFNAWEFRTSYLERGQNRADLDVLLAEYVHTGERAEIVNEIGKPYAVLTVNYGEPVRGFVEGEFYVLKVLQVRGTRVDYGFCPVKREAFYAKD